MASPYRLRKVDGEGEAETLHRLHDICFADSAPRIDPTVGDWWLACLDAEPVAFAGAVASQQSDNAGYLSRSGVVPGHRGQGLQLRLIRAREAQARRYGWSWMFTDTTGNPASSNTLIRAGYRLYQPKFVWAFQHSLYWRKQL